MGIWREAFRPHCHGLYVEGDGLYAQRYVSDPAFRLLATEDERRDFLAPVPLPLDDARVFLDVERGPRRPLELPDDIVVHAPGDVPPSRGGTSYTLSVFVGERDVYLGYPTGGGEARNVFWAIEKLLKRRARRTDP